MIIITHYKHKRYKHTYIDVIGHLLHLVSAIETSGGVNCINNFIFLLVPGSCLRTMDSHFDETRHTICLWKFENNKKYKEHILQEIAVSVCAMLNSNGGKVVIPFEKDRNDIPIDGSLLTETSLVIRVLEQYIISITGQNQTISKINFSNTKDGITISIKKADSLITNNYNLYLPSQEQVVEMSPLEPLEDIKNYIVYRKVIPDPVELGSHCQVFSKDQKCDFHESKVVQLKHLKADPSKRTTLADRITGKSNKLSCYISAFANYSGGHIYYGITDKKVVKGEFIPTQKGKEEITKKVEKTLTKMIWPQQIGQPKRGEHWELFFEPVMDENFTPVPSTFVIVIHVTPCLGGVFTEEPECYEMVDGKVRKMSFATWKKRTLQPIWLREKERIPPYPIARVTWSSPAVQKAFTASNEKLRELINDGDWFAFSRLSARLQKQSPLIETKLAVLTKQAIACYRRGHFSRAHNLLNQYFANALCVDDALIFEVVGLLIQAGLKRATGDFKGLKQAMIAALSKAELIEPGLVTAAVYAFASTVSDLISFEEPTNNKISSDVFSIRALEHSQHVDGCSGFQADEAQKAHITLATFYLGCNLSGQSLIDNIATSDLHKAKHSLMTVYESICEGNLLSNYREVQFKLVQCMYYYRHSQVTNEKRDYFLQNAFNYAKKAECLARDHQFNELVEWSQANKALCTEELVREKLIELNLPFIIDPKLCATKGCSNKEMTLISH